MKIFATILTFFGGFILLSNLGIIETSLRQLVYIWWPVILIFAGLWILIRKSEEQNRRIDESRLVSTNSEIISSSYPKAGMTPYKGNIIETIWNGDAGLAKTYWIYGIIAGFAWGLILALVNFRPGSREIILFLICFGIYFFVVNVGIWRAANKYEGRRVWALLGKLAAALSMFQVIVIFASVIWLIFN